MKRVLVVAEWINLTGGVTRTLLELLKRLDSADFDVTLYVMRPGESELAAVPQHIRVIASEFTLPYLGARRVLQHLARRGRILSAFRYMAVFARWRLGGSRAAYARYFVNRHPGPAGHYDVALAYAMLDAYCNQYVAERVEAPRKIMWCHSDAALYSDRALSGLESVFAQFDAINCVSKGAEDSMRRRFPALDGQLRVRYNLMDGNSIKRRSTEPVPPSPPGAIVLTTVARITPEKGIDLLVEVAIMLRDAGYEFVWWVVGPDYHPAYSAEVKARCAAAGLDEVVCFVGAQVNPYPYMSACDIYVQPSRIEGFCTTTAEARILSKPVVCTDVDGADEQFVRGVTGSIVPVTAEGLFLEIARLIDSPEVREAYREALQMESRSAEPAASSFLE